MDASEYAKLYNMYKSGSYRASGARVLRETMIHKEVEPAQKVQPVAEPTVKTELDKEFRRFVDTMNSATESVLNLMASEGVMFQTASGTDIQHNLKDAGDIMASYMDRVFSSETITGMNNTDPTRFLSENVQMLENALSEHVQILDTFLNNTLDVGMNIEEGELLQEEQMQELVIQAVAPYLYEQVGIETEEFLPSRAVIRGRTRRRETGVAKKVTKKKKEEQITEELTTPSVSLFQMPLWGFNSLRPGATSSEVTQSNSIIQSIMDYASVLAEVTPSVKGNELKVNRAAARRALRSLKDKGRDLSDLRTNQLEQSSTFWNYALLRFRSFLAEEAIATLLPGLLAMMIQSGAGYLIAWMNRPSAAQSATVRMRQELEKIPKDDVEAQRRFALKLYLDEQTEQLDETNIHSYLEKLRGVENKSEQELNVRLAYESWRELTKDLQKRLVELPSPFIDVDAHMRIIRSDKVIELSSVDRDFYEAHRDLLNEFASRYTGEIVPVTDIIGNVRLPGLLYQDQVNRLPGAEAFLDNRIKLLHMAASVEEVQRASLEGANLWATSQEVATNVLLDTPNQVLTQVASFQALGITDALNQVSGIAIPDRQPSQFEIQIARHKMLAEAISKATEKYIKKVAEPIPTETLQDRAAELNKDAAWEALGSMLVRGSNNTVLNNLVLSILASISKAMTRQTLMHILNQFPSLLTSTLRGTLNWIPRLSSSVFQYGIVSHMLGLATAHGIVGTTNILEEWDAYMDQNIERMGGMFGTAQRKLILGFMKGLRAMSNMSLNFMSYINRNSMVGWMSFAVLIGLHGSLSIYQTLTSSVAVAAFQTAIQSSGLIVMAGVEGAVHTILNRKMQRYIEDRRRAVELANRRGATQEDLIAAQNAQLALYMTPIRWAVWGSAITVSLNVARLLMSSDGALWNMLFQADFPERAIGVPGTVEQVPEWIRDLETSLTGSADYSDRYTFVSTINNAVSAAAGKRPF